MQDKTLHMVAFVLLAIGGLNWLLVGVSGWEIGALFGGMESVVSRTIYVLVGLAAIYEIATHKTGCKVCSVDGSNRSSERSQPGQMGGNGDLT